MAAPICIEMHGRSEDELRAVLKDSNRQEEAFYMLLHAQTCPTDCIARLGFTHESEVVEAWQIKHDEMNPDSIFIGLDMEESARVWGSRRDQKPHPRIPIDQWILDDVEKKFLKYICKHHGGSDDAKANSEAASLFDAIQDAFSEGESAIVDPDLIQNLAACAVIALGYDHDERIPWETLAHDAILDHVLRGFMKSLAGAIREGRCVQRDGHHHFGAFRIPSWFVQWAKQLTYTPSSRNSFFLKSSE